MRSPASLPRRRVSGSVLGAPRYPGETVSYVADLMNGVEWLFEHSGDGSAYPWRFVGGDYIIANVDTDETFTADNTARDTATVGPTVTAPLGGDYEIEQHVTFYNTSANVTQAAGVANGAGATFLSTPARAEITAANKFFSPEAASKRMAAVAVGTELRMRYVAASGVAHVMERVLKVRPLRAA